MLLRRVVAPAQMVGSSLRSLSGVAKGAPVLPKGFAARTEDTGVVVPPEPGSRQAANIKDAKPFRYRLKPGEAEALRLSPAMSRVVDLSNASQAELNQVEAASYIARTQRHKTDTGSPEAQVAVMTARITRLAAHLKDHHKDRHSKRGLTALVNDRRKLMKYLKHKDLGRYQDLIAELKLRDNIK